MPGNARGECVGCGKETPAFDSFMSYGKGPFCSAEHRDLFAGNRPRCHGLVDGGSGVCLKKPRFTHPGSDGERDVFTCEAGHVFEWPLPEGKEPFTDEGIARWEAKMWRPELPQRYRDAIPLLVEYSGAGFTDEAWWLRAMSALATTVARFEAGMEFEADWIRAQPTGPLADLVLAHLGSSPPPTLVRELDRRLETVRSVRHPADERIGDDEAEQYWRVWTAIRKVVAAADPEAPRS